MKQLLVLIGCLALSACAPVTYRQVQRCVQYGMQCREAREYGCKHFRQMITSSGDTIPLTTGTGYDVICDPVCVETGTFLEPQ